MNSVGMWWDLTGKKKICAGCRSSESGRSTAKRPHCSPFLLQQLPSRDARGGHRCGCQHSSASRARQRGRPRGSDCRGLAQRHSALPGRLHGQGRKWLLGSGIAAAEACAALKINKPAVSCDNALWQLRPCVLLRGLEGQQDTACVKCRQRRAPAETTLRGNGVSAP